jgi:hypothetical protein
VDRSRAAATSTHTYYVRGVAEERQAMASDAESKCSVLVLEATLGAIRGAKASGAPLDDIVA